jgi:Zn-dependent protease with chaperone function
MAKANNQDTPYSGENQVNPLLFLLESKGRLWLLFLMMIPVYLYTVYPFSTFILSILNEFIRAIEEVLYQYSNASLLRHNIFSYLPFYVLAIAGPFYLYHMSRKKNETFLCRVKDDFPEIWNVYNNIWKIYGDFGELKKQLRYIPELYYSNECRHPYIFYDIGSSDTKKKARIVLTKVWIDVVLSKDLIKNEKAVEACLLHEISHLIDKDIHSIELARHFMLIYSYMLPFACAYIVSSTLMRNVLIPVLVLPGPIVYLTLFRAARQVRELSADVRTMVYQETNRFLNKLLSEISKEVNEQITAIRAKNFIYKLYNQVSFFPSKVENQITELIDRIFPLYPPAEDRIGYLQTVNSRFLGFNGKRAFILGLSTSTIFIASIGYAIIVLFLIVIIPFTGISIENIEAIEAIDSSLGIIMQAPLVGILVYMILVAITPIILAPSIRRFSLFKICLSYITSLICFLSVFAIGKLYLRGLDLHLWHYIPIYLVMYGVDRVALSVYVYYKISRRYVRLYSSDSVLSHMKRLVKWLVLLNVGFSVLLYLFTKFGFSYYILILYPAVYLPVLFSFMKKWLVLLSVGFSVVCLYLLRNFGLWTTFLFLCFLPSAVYSLSILFSSLMESNFCKIRMKRLVKWLVLLNVGFFVLLYLSIQVGFFYYILTFYPAVCLPVLFSFMKKWLVLLSFGGIFLLYLLSGFDLWYILSRLELWITFFYFSLFPSVVCLMISLDSYMKKDPFRKISKKISKRLCKISKRHAKYFDSVLSRMERFIFGDDISQN